MGNQAFCKEGGREIGRGREGEGREGEGREGEGRREGEMKRGREIGRGEKIAEKEVIKGVFRSTVSKHCLMLVGMLPSGRL